MSRIRAANANRNTRVATRSEPVRNLALSFGPELSADNDTNWHLTPPGSSASPALLFLRAEPLPRRRRRFWEIRPSPPPLERGLGYRLDARRDLVRSSVRPG